MLGIVNSIRDLVASFQEKMEEGYLKTEFPSGLDPVGAIGQAIQQVCDIYRERFSRIKELLGEFKGELSDLSLLLEERGDKIEVQRIKEIVERLAKAEERIEKELRFLKDI